VNIRRINERNVSNRDERRQRREEIVWRLYNEGWFAGNLDLMLGLLDPGIVWTAIEDAPDAGTYRGYEGVRAYWQDWLDDFDMHAASIEESIEAGDRLVCVQRATTTGKGSGVRSEIHYACVYTFGDDERIVEVNEYAARDQALAAANMKP
jgi:ketosteroid isomerase-like protein